VHLYFVWVKEQTQMFSITAVSSCYL